MRHAYYLSIIALASLLAVPVQADPPAHAKAHGWRAKHVGASGHEWTVDYGVASGHCDHRAIATAVGGVVGGVIARRVAEPENRTAATIVGVAAGALIGHEVGRRIDKADEACVGHALEIGRTGRAITWLNESTGVSYRLTPRAPRMRNAATCREFELVAVRGGSRSTRQGLACEADRGTWRIVE